MMGSKIRLSINQGRLKEFRTIIKIINTSKAARIRLRIKEAVRTTNNLKCTKSKII